MAPPGFQVSILDRTERNRGTHTNCDHLHVAIFQVSLQWVMLLDLPNGEIIVTWRETIHWLHGRIGLFLDIQVHRSHVYDA